MIPEIVRILTERSVVVGAGFLCAPRGFILTCHHVVADAVGQPRNKPIRAGTEVPVSFPSSAEPVRASVVASSPVMKHDLALLRVEEERLPAECVGAPVALAPLTRGMAVRFYGFPEGYDYGVWGFGKLQFAVSWDRFQVEAKDIGAGFSGAPVQEMQFGQIIGLVCLSDRERGSAFIITASSIEAFTKELTISGAARYFRSLTEGLAGLPGEPLIGLESFLENYLGTAEAPAPFGGRDRQLSQLDEWLRHETSQCGLLVAPAGRGKSALLTVWASIVATSGTADVAFIPISNRFETSSKSRTLALLAKRLRFVCGGELAKWPATPDEWMSEIDFRLRTDRPDPRKPLLVILDGLDEASDWTAGADIRFRSRLGKSVKVLLSARMLAGDIDETGWAERVGWTDRATSIALPLLDRDGLQQVLQANQETAHLVKSRRLVDELLRLTEGDPLLVRMYVEALHGKGATGAFLETKDLPDISPGLDGFIQRWVEDQRRQWRARGEDPDELEQRSKTLFFMLSIAVGPLTTEDIAAVAPQESRLGDAMYLGQVVRTIARFIVGDGRRQGYVFSHPRLRDYYDRLIGSEKERRDWDQRFVDYGARTLDDMGEGRLDPGDAPRYVIQYYRVHLARTKAPRELFYRLVSRPWLEAWYAREGAYSGFLNDISAVWELAESADDRAMEIHCLLCHSSAASRSSAFFPAFLLRCVQLKTVSSQQALSFLQQTPDESAVTESIKLLTPILSTSLVEQAVDIARSLAKPALRLIAMGAGAACLHGARRQIIVSDILRELPNVPPEARAKALVDLTRLLPEQAWQELVEIIDRMPERLKAEVLSTAGPGLTPMVAPRVLGMAAAMRWADYREQALIGLAPDLSRLREPAAIHAAQVIRQRSDRAMYLVRLCSRARSMGVAAAAMEQIERLTKADARASLLVEFAPHLPAELLPRALNIALRLEAEDLQSRALSALAPLFSPADWAAIQPCLRRMTFIENAARVELAHFLCAPVPEVYDVSAVPDPGGMLALIRQPMERAQIFIELRACGRIAIDVFDEEILARLIPTLGEAGAEAVVARAAELMAPAQRRELLDYLLEQRPMLGHLLPALLPHLPAEDVERLGDFLRPIHDEPAQARLMCLLAQSNAASLCGDPWWWLGAAEEQALASGLEALAPHFADQQAKRAIELARTIQDRELRARTMARLGVRFGGQVVHEAIDAVFAWQQVLAVWAEPIALLLRELIPAMDEGAVWRTLESRRKAEAVADPSLALALRSRLPLAFGRAEPPSEADAEIVLAVFRDASLDDTLGALSLSIPPGFWRAGAMARMAGREWGRRRQELFEEAAAQLPDAKALDEDFVLSLIGEMPPGVGKRAEQRLLSAINLLPEKERIPPLERIAPKLSPAGLLTAVAIAVRLGWDGMVAIAPACTHWMAQWRLLWGAQRAYARAGSTPIRAEEPRLEELLNALAPRLRYSPVMRQAVRLAQQIDKGYMSETLTAAPNLVRFAVDGIPSQMVLSAALEAVARVRLEVQRSELLVELAPFLWDKNAEQALGIAQTIQFPGARARALIAVHPQLSAGLAQSCLSRIAAALPDTSPDLRQEILVRLSLEGRPYELTTLLTLVWAVWDSGDRETLLRLSPRREAAQPAYVALGLAERLHKGKAAARPLCSLLAHPALRNAASARQAVAALSATADSMDYVRALFELWLTFSGPERLGIQRILLKAIELINPQAGAPACLALCRDRRVSDWLRGELAHQAWLFARRLEPGEGLDRMESLWTLLASSDAEDAWRWSWSVPNLALQQSIQKRLPAEHFKPPGERDLKESWRIKNPAERFEAIFSAFRRAPGLEAAAGPLAFECALEIGASKRGAYLERCCHLMDTDRRLLAFERACEPGVAGAREIAEMMARDGLTGSQRFTMLSAIAAIPEERRRSVILGFIAKFLLPDCEESLLEEACKMEDSATRIETATELLLLLMEPLSLKAARLIVEAEGLERIPWDVLLRASNTVRGWALKYPAAYGTLWRETTRRAARTTRARAIAQMSLLVAAATDENSEIGPRIETAVAKVGSWWP